MNTASSIRAILALAALSSAAAAGAQTPKPNVLLITVDTVRADHIGAYGYTKGSTPNMDRLAREGVRFADATAQAPLTGPAHAAILTGIYPARYGVRDNATSAIPASVTTMAEMFKAAGYQTGGFVGAFILSAPYGFGQGFDTFDADFTGYSDGAKLQVQRRAQDVVERAQKWMNAQNGPFFAWVHFYDAHAPYDAPPPYGARFRAAPYDGEIAYVDSAIGTLLQSLDTGGRLDRTVVSVLADHGESLGDHGESEHGVFLYEPVLHIPWIVRLPNHEHQGTTVAEQVRAIDVLPTLASIAGVKPPPGIDGESVAALMAGSHRAEPPASYAETYYPKWHYGWSELRSVRADSWKYIDAPRPELYDMKKDAGEQANAIDARGALANGLSNELKRIAGAFGAVSAAAPQPDPDTLARLRSLGYVGIAAPSPGVRGADPKDMIVKGEAFRGELSRAIDALDRNQPDAAIARLTALLAVNERSYELHLFLGDARLARGELDKALGEYDAAGVLNPQSAAPPLSAARALISQGDTARARQKIDQAAALEPNSPDIPLVRGMAREQEGQNAQALTEYAAAVRANGSDAQPRVRLASLAMRMKAYDQAEPQFEALLRLGYRPSRMHFGLGQIAEARGDAARAIAEYQETLKLEPAFAEAKNGLARLSR